MEHISKLSEDVGEVVFGQPEERAGATEPDGSVLDRRKDDEWLEDTEPYHGARPRTTEIDRPVDVVLGATLGGTEQNFDFRDKSVPNLPPEQRIRQEEEIQTPPRREPRRRIHTEERNYNPNRDQSTVGADHPGLPASVDRCPSPSVDTLNSHRLWPVFDVIVNRYISNH